MRLDDLRFAGLRIDRDVEEDRTVPLVLLEHLLELYHDVLAHADRVYLEMHRVRRAAARLLDGLDRVGDELLRRAVFVEAELPLDDDGLVGEDERFVRLQRLSEEEGLHLAREVFEHGDRKRVAVLLRDLALLIGEHPRERDLHFLVAVLVDEVDDRTRRRIELYLLLVFLQRVARDVKPHHFLFERELYAFGPFRRAHDRHVSGR